MVTEQQELSPSHGLSPLWRRIRRAILLYIVVPYLAVTAIFVALQRWLIYRPTVAESLRIKDLGINSDFGVDVELTTADGDVLRGWLLNGGGGRKRSGGVVPLVIYFPGNSLNRYERITDLREVASRGFDVLVFDYRGFGDSTGAPCESDLSDDALLIWDFAQGKLAYDANDIVVFGESLGAAVALSMWSGQNSDPPDPAALILSSAFASLPQTVEWHYPLFPFQFLLLDRWPSIERIRNVQVPVIVFHGTDDKIVPVAHGLSLAQAAPDARFIEIDGGTHNEIPVLQLSRELDSLMAVLSAAPAGSGSQ